MLLTFVCICKSNVTDTIHSVAFNELNSYIMTQNMTSNVLSNITHIATMDVVQFYCQIVTDSTFMLQCTGIQIIKLT